MTESAFLMRSESEQTRIRFLLQQAGLSIPGCAQLVSGDPVGDPRDRAVLALLLGRSTGAGTAHPPIVPSPVPPIPLPVMGPIMPSASGQRARRGRGAGDSIWIDLGFPPPAEVRRSLALAGVSRQGIEALSLSLPIAARQDRIRLADWFVRGTRRAQ